MPRSLPLFAGGAAAVITLFAVPACSTGIAESSASPNDFARCLTDNGVPQEFATPPQGPRPGGPPGGDGQAPQGPPPGADGQPPQGPPPAGQRPPPPVPDGVDAGTWNDAFAACADLAPPHPPGRGGPPPA